MKELNLGADIYTLPKRKVLVYWEMYLAIEAEKQKQQRLQTMKAKNQARRGRRK